MILLTFLLKARVASLVRALIVGGCVALCAASVFAAQPNYVLIDLTSTTGYGDAYAASGGAAAGTVSTSANFLDATRATLWTGTSLIDLHPLTLLGSANTKSSVQGFSGNLQVGWGIGPNTRMQFVPIAWHGKARSAAILTLPFTACAAQAVATDGVQIVGFAGTRNGSPFHALVWNARTGAVTNLGVGGNGAQALCVAHGQQAGFTTRSSGPVATIWAGTASSQIVLHPNNDAVVSEILATNGLRQAGFCGFDSQVIDKATHSSLTKRINKAFVWDATVAGARSIHPAVFQQSYATSINGSSIVGYAYNDDEEETTERYHALLWNSSLQLMDLNVFLPPGFTGAMANSIDAEGTIAGTIFTTDGVRHAAVWIPAKSFAR